MEELIIKFLQGRATPAEARRLGAWRAASSENDRLFHEFAAVWGELREPEVVTMPPSPASIAAKAEARRVTRAHPARATSRFRRRGWVTAIAAGLVLAAVGAGDFVWRQLASPPPSLAALRIVTGPNETVTTQLSDGTVVHLAADSRLEVLSATEHREVWVEGRAFFGVAKHPERDFIVRSRFGQARVLGTRFEFSTRADRARVLVVDGRVAFEGNGENVEIVASQMIESAADRPAVVSELELEDVEEALDWMGQSLVFHDTPLFRAAREIEDRYAAEVEISDPELASQTVSGGFDEQSFDAVMRTICRVVDAQCVIAPNRAVLTPRRR